ncbi:MAG: hypothetical protein M3Z15_04960, partial [Pseudomonadota bacterium]|nr:hypothetical protein [Pseudomonadota bacterium]
MNPIRTARHAATSEAARTALAVAALLLGGCDKPASTPIAATATTASNAAKAPTTATTTAATAAAPTTTTTTTAAAPEHAESGIAWRQAANDSEIDAAFAAARSENKPVFVYWGAKWC